MRLGGKREMHLFAWGYISIKVGNRCSIVEALI